MRIATCKLKRADEPASEYLLTEVLSLTGELEQFDMPEVLRSELRTQIRDNLGELKRQGIRITLTVPV